MVYPPNPPHPAIHSSVRLITHIPAHKHSPSVKKWSRNGQISMRFSREIVSDGWYGRVPSLPSFFGTEMVNKWSNFQLGLLSAHRSKSSIRPRGRFDVGVGDDLIELSRLLQLICSGLRRLHLLDHFPEFLEGDVLDLADALAGDAKFLADFFESLLGAAVQTKTGAEDGGFARIEGLDHFLKHASDGLFLEVLVRSVGVFVLDDFGEVVGV